MAQLPFDDPDFIGRKALVTELSNALGDGGHHMAISAISAVAGIGGVGKTALAVHIGHRLRDRFLDGQLYVNLRGTDPVPLTPEAALRYLLRSLGLDDDGIPDDLDECAALYRWTVDGGKLLILLDNASAERQVRPLMPGSGTSKVMITSRGRLLGLTGVRHVDLDVLDPADALALLRRIVGAERVDAEPEISRELLRACGLLPLAVRIAAARLAARPQWTVARLAERLADERRRLTELHAGDLAVEATFALSYQQLDPEDARAFRLLTAANTTDVHLSTAAMILDRDEPTAERQVVRRLFADVRSHAAHLTTSGSARSSPVRVHPRLRRLRRLPDQCLHRQRERQILTKRRVRTGMDRG